MNTSILPHSEYASGQSALAQQKPGSTTPQADGAVKQTEASKPKRSFLFDNPIISFNKSVPEPEERSFVIGLFNDVFKNVAKILTGSLLTDTIKALNKNGDLTWQQAIYATLVDSGPSRIITDTVSTFAVRFFNGNHSFLGLFKLPYIAPELSSQLFALPCVTLSRAMTQKENVNSMSAKGNMSEENKLIKQKIMEANHPFYRFSNVLSSGFGKHIKPYMDKVFALIGVHAGKPMFDKEGKPVYDHDENGQIKKDRHGKPKQLMSNPQIDKNRLFTVTAGSFIGSFFLPKHTTAFGFEKATSIPRVFASILFTSLCRLNTTLIHNATGMHFNGGANFDAAFKTSVIEKMLVPFTQYAADAFGTYLRRFIPFMNGATISNILRIIVEVPATYLSNGILNVAKEDRMNDDWTYLSHKLWKPTSDMIETVTKPLFEFLARYVYAPVLGMFDPRIPNMYGVDIRPEDTKAKDELPKEIEAKYSSKLGKLGDMLFYLRKGFALPYDIGNLVKQCAEHAVEVEQDVATKVAEANAKIDARKALALAQVSEKASSRNIMSEKNLALAV